MTVIPALIYIEAGFLVSVTQDSFPMTLDPLSSNGLASPFGRYISAATSEYIHIDILSLDSERSQSTGYAWYRTRLFVFGQSTDAWCWNQR